MGNLTTLEKFAKDFAKEIGREYQENLDFWIATAMDDRGERKMWEERIETEVPVVVENAYKKILDLLNYNHKQRKKYLLKKGLFRDKNILNINHKMGFFNNLLPGRDIKYSFPINVEYHIHIKNLSVERVVFPHRPRK